MCPTGKVIFQAGHVLIFPAVYTSFIGLYRVQILAGHVKIFAGHVNFDNHVPDGHVNQMLNVKPCVFSGVTLGLLSGVLSLGVGDTVASVLGTKIGLHQWPGMLAAAWHKTLGILKDLSRHWKFIDIIEKFCQIVYVGLELYHVYVKRKNNI